jgi:transposase
MVAREADVLTLDAAVEQLDLSAMETKYTRVGPPGYHPKALLKVLIYGYSLGLRSSRDLDRACRMDMAFRFLAHELEPDFRTICRFRRSNAQQLKELFRQTVRLCQQAGLVSLGHVAIDGTKVRANRSARTLGEAQQTLAQALEEAEGADADIPDEQDEECRFMRTPQGIRPAYNAQVAVDCSHQVIVAQEVVTAQCDRHQLAAMVQQVQRNCEAPPEAVSADGDYSAHESVEKLDAQGIGVYVPAPTSGAAGLEWVEEEGAYRCAQGHWLRPYRVRKGRQVYRTHVCGGCAWGGQCGVKGRFKEVHVPLPGSALDRLAGRMRSESGQAIYAARKTIVEPVIGHLKHNRGFWRFLLRGRSGAAGEWSLMCIAHNLGKWAQAQLSAPHGAINAAAHAGRRLWDLLSARLRRVLGQLAHLSIRPAVIRPLSGAALL